MSYLNGIIGLSSVLLGYLGVAMIREGLSDDDEDDDKQFLGAWEMIMLSVATSLDAMAVVFNLCFSTY